MVKGVELAGIDGWYCILSDFSELDFSYLKKKYKCIYAHATYYNGAVLIKKKSGGIPYTAHGAKIPLPPFISIFVLCLF